MDSFEQAFSDTERAAISTQKSATALVTLAKQLQKAAKEGNIAEIKRLQNRFNAEKKPGLTQSQNRAFLESLYSVYSDIVREDNSGTGRMDFKGSGRVVPLDRIYRLSTSLPGISIEYDRTEFARRLYFLDSNGPKQTRRGAIVDFSSSTGTRSSKGLFSFVGPDGQDVTYYGIRFMGDA